MSTKTNISGFIYYKSKDTKEIYFESIKTKVIGKLKTYILNEVEDDLKKYMITIDGSNNIIDGSNAIPNMVERIQRIKTPNRREAIIDISNGQNNLIQKLKGNLSINEFLNAVSPTDKGSTNTLSYKANVDNIQQIRTALANNDKKKFNELSQPYLPNNLLQNKYKELKDNNVNTVIKIIHKKNADIIDATIKNHPHIINYLFFMLKTLNINFINRFNTCQLNNTDKLIIDCVKVVRMNIDRVYFFTIIYDGENIKDIYINNNSMNETLDNNSNVSDINTQLNNYMASFFTKDYSNSDKLTLIMEKFGML